MENRVEGEWNLYVRSPEGASTLEQIGVENLKSWAEEHGHDPTDIGKCAALLAASVSELLTRASEAPAHPMSPETRELVNQMLEDSRKR